METKKGNFVSTMKDRIIEASIEALRNEGLKFSVDTLSGRLKISKKTVYKFFPDKETLALALYERYYITAMGKAKDLICAPVQIKYRELLRLYFDSKKMIRQDIFNKYKLNDTVYAFAADRNDDMWSLLSASFPEGVDTPTLRTIVDGTFEKLCRDGADPDNVIEKLVNLLC